MQGLATKAATSAVKSSVKKELKANLPTAPQQQGRGGRLRTGDSFGDKAQGCCNKCCETVCRTSPWTQVICWTMIALTITTVIVWLGGAFLVGPAKNNNGKGVCGVTLNIPLLNKDAYVWYLSSTGIIVMVMIFSSCICCCSFFCVCVNDFSKTITILGIVGFIITTMALSIYVGWIALGTYFVIRIHSADTVCRNTIVYLVLLYIYLVIVLLVGVVLLVWKCNDAAKKSGSGSAERRTRTSKRPS